MLMTIPTAGCPEGVELRGVVQPQAAGPQGAEARGINRDPRRWRCAYQSGIFFQGKVIKVHATPWPEICVPDIRCNISGSSQPWSQSVWFRQPLQVLRFA